MQVHDFDHRGFNNAFEVNSKSELAIRYNDASVLENHHVAATFAIMRQEDCNIFSNCSDEVRAVKGRERVIYVVCCVWHCVVH